MNTDACDAGPPAKRRSSKGAAASHVEETRPSNGSAPTLVPRAECAPSLGRGRARSLAASLGRDGPATPGPAILGDPPVWGTVKPEWENPRVPIATQRRLNNIVLERFTLRDRIAVLEMLLLALDNE